MHWFRLDFLLLLYQDKSKKEPAQRYEINIFILSGKVKS